MYLVQILVPTYDNDGQRFPTGEFTRVRSELTASFGGMTAYTRSPAQGTWEDEDGRVKHDDVVVFEVMVEAVDRPWWVKYRAQLTERFRQDTLVVRATRVELL